jgi:hypothetical protein
LQLSLLLNNNHPQIPVTLDLDELVVNVWKKQ